MSHHLGIDLGGTKVVLAVGDDAGEPTASRRLATPQSGDWRADLSVLASEATCARLSPDFISEALDPVVLKGKKEAVALRRLVGQRRGVN